MPIRKALAVALVVLCALAATANGRDSRDTRDTRDTNDERGREDAHRGRYVTNRAAYLYSRPSADAKILTRIKPKTVVEVVGANEQWLEVRSTSGRPNG